MTGLIAIFSRANYSIGMGVNSNFFALRLTTLCRSTMRSTLRRAKAELRIFGLALMVGVPAMSFA